MVKKTYGSWHVEPCHRCGTEFQLTRGDPIELDVKDEILCESCAMYSKGHDDGVASTDADLRYPLRKFACLMEEKLRQNDYKGKEGWRGNDLNNLFSKLLEEVHELHLALGTGKDVDEEAADVANMAMIIADVWRRG